MKRYVLLEDKTIVDTRDTEFKYEVIDEPTLFRSKSNGYGGVLGKIKLQSDNILDFAEVGDMVEFVDEQGLDYIHLTEDFPASKVNELTLDFEIIAIWKRNGDVMRRYER